MIISPVLFWKKKTVIYQRSKHIDIKFQFISDEINKGSILLGYIETEKNIADVFMKPQTNDRNKIKHFQKDYSR